jgi:hypothetical protein
MPTSKVQQIYIVHCIPNSRNLCWWHCQAGTIRNR